MGCLRQQQEEEQPSHVSIGKQQHSYTQQQLTLWTLQPAQVALHVKSAIQAGDIDAATAILRQHCPSLLEVRNRTCCSSQRPVQLLNEGACLAACLPQDQRLVFRLCKLKFIAYTVIDAKKAIGQGLLLSSSVLLLSSVLGYADVSG